MLCLSEKFSHVLEIKQWNLYENMSCGMAFHWLLGHTVHKYRQLVRMSHICMPGSGTTVTSVKTIEIPLLM